MNRRLAIASLTGLWLILAGPLVAWAADNPFPLVRWTAERGTDVHMHVLPMDDDVTYDGQNVVMALWSAGLSRGCVISQGYQRPASQPDCVRLNDWTWSQVQRFPDRLVGICGVPVQATWAPDEVRRCAAKGYRWLKLHTRGNGVSIRDPQTAKQLDRLVVLAHSLQMRILIHGNFTETAESQALLDLVRRHPRQTFIIAHFLNRDVELLGKHPLPNAYVDLSPNLALLRHTAFIPQFMSSLRAFGMDRVLFGSDYPVAHPAESLKALRQLPFTADELDAVVWRNAEQLIPVH